MQDFKLKLAIAILSSLIFSFIFIAITFAIPLKREGTEEPSRQVIQNQVDTKELLKEISKKFGKN